MDKKKYCEANSVAERSQPEPESSVDFDNDDEDKLVIVEDPKEALAISTASDTANVTLIPEVRKNFRGPKKKFLEAFHRSESIAEGDSTTESPESLGPQEISGQGEVGSSSIDKEDSNSTPVPDSNQSDPKACDSTKGDEDSNDRKRNGIPMFNLRSCIDLIIDSRLIRERLNTSDDILNEQYNIKVSLSRVNEGKTVRELAQSNRECKTLRNVLHQRLSDDKDWEDTVTVSARDSHSRDSQSRDSQSRDSQSRRISTSAEVCVEPSVSAISPGDRSERKQTSASVSRKEVHSPLHHIAALASVLPQEPIVIADDDKIVTAQPTPRAAVPTREVAYPVVQSEKVMHPVTLKKSMPPLIDTRHTSPPVIDLVNCASSPRGQGYKSSPWPGHTDVASGKNEHSDFPEKKVHLPATISRPMPVHENPYRSMSSSHSLSHRSHITELVHRTIDAAWASYPSPSSKIEQSDRFERKAQVHPTHSIPPPTHDQYHRSSSSSNPNSVRVSSRGPSPHVVDNPSQNEMSWSGNRAQLYPSSGGQLVGHNRSATSGQLSPVTSAGTGWGSSHPAGHRSGVSPVGQHPSYSAYHQHHHSPGSIRQSAEHPAMVHGQTHKPVPVQQSSGSYNQHVNSQGDYRDSAYRDYSSYTKVMQAPGMPSARVESQKDPARRSDYEYPGAPYPTPRAPGHYGPKGPPPRLLYVPNAATTTSQQQENIPSKVHALASEVQQHERIHHGHIDSSRIEPHWSKPYQPRQLTPELSKHTQNLAAPPSAPSPLDLTVRSKPYFPSLPVQGVRENDGHFKKPPREEAPLDLTVRRPTKPSQHQVVTHSSPRPQEMYPSSIDYRIQPERSAVEQLSPGQRQAALSRSPNLSGMIPQATQQHGFTPVMPPHRGRMSTSPHPQSSPVLGSPASHQSGTPQLRPAVDSISELRTVGSSLAITGHERQLVPSISRGVIDPEIEMQQTQALNQQQLQQQLQQQQFQGINKGQPKMSTTAQLLGNHPPHDILYLKCNVCTSTYGSLHSFRKHFWKVHGYGPTNEHVTVRSISATRGSATKTEKAMDEIEKPVQAELVQSQIQSSPTPPGPSGLSSPDNSGQAYDMVHMQVQRRCTLGEMNHKMAPLSEANQLDSLGAAKSASPNQKQDTMQSTMRCLQCGQDFPTRDWGVFRRHVRAHEQPTLRCTVCRQAFTSTRDLHEHNRTYHQDQMWICRICGVGFVNPGDLGKHMKLIHPLDAANEEEYKCQLCPLVFDDVQLLLNHLNDHKDQPELVSQYAELLVPGSNVVRASPDSTNDVDNKPAKDGIKQEVDACEVLPEQESGSKSVTDSELQAPSVKRSISCTTLDSAGKQSTLLKMPKKALYDFIKDRVEIEARRQLGGLSQESLDSKEVVQPLKSASPMPSTKTETTLGPSYKEGVIVEQKSEEASAFTKPPQTGPSAEGVPASEKGTGRVPYTTVRDTLHMLVERAIVHDYKSVRKDKNDDVSSTKATSVETGPTALSLRSTADGSSAPPIPSAFDSINDATTKAQSTKLVISETGKEAIDMTAEQAAEEHATKMMPEETAVYMDEQKSQPSNTRLDQIQETVPQVLVSDKDNAKQKSDSAEERQELNNKSNASKDMSEGKKDTDSSVSVDIDSNRNEPSEDDVSKSSKEDEPTASGGQGQKRPHPPELVEKPEGTDIDHSISPSKKSKIEVATN